MATASVVTVMRVIDAKRCPSRSKFSDSPAIRAITVVAIPVMTWSWPAIDSLMTLPR